ncbi:MAG: hypothetical protein R3B09_10885 [Nannocystaceae bacterium]
MTFSNLPTIASALSLSALCGALLMMPACEPKEGDDTGGSSEGSTTGDDSSSGGSQSGSSTSGSGTSDTNATSGSSSDSGTSGNSTGTSGTSGEGTGEVSTDTGDMSTGSTSLTTEPTGDSTVDPTEEPADCQGDPKALEFVTSMAYLKSQIPPDMTTSGGSSGSSTGGDEPDPATLYIKLSSQIFTCKDPSANLDCGPEWEVTIVIPPEFQTPGALYDLSGQDVFAVFGETGADEGNNMCSFGGGSGEGTFQILDIDQNQVKGRLCGVPTWFFSETMPDLEGTFVAERC